MPLQDFSRPLHMLLGLPFDAVRMDDVVRMLCALPGTGRRWFISTPNLNFLMAARSDPYFRQSVLDSDLSLADGMPIVWIARLLGIPLPERVPGSGLIEQLRDSPPADGEPPLKVFFFGGEPGLATRAHETLNAKPCGLKSVGAIDPGYGSIESLGKAEYIDRINAARPDFLIVALGAKKGQAWIMANRAALDVPMVSHLGAVIKFIAGEVERAPDAYQRFGLEWLWRIREEPTLWRRYVRDAAALSRLLLTRVLPLALRNRLRRRRAGAAGIRMTEPDENGRRRIVLSGYLDAAGIADVRRTFREIAAAKTPVDLDFTAVRHVDSAFLGQLHLLRSCARSDGFDLRLRNLPRPIRQVFRWSLCEYLLDPAPR